MTDFDLECRHLLSRMLVTDPKQRATMHEVMNHPWMIKGYSGPPENYLPHREPITLPLESEVINAMTGFNFGSPEVIRANLTRTIESDEYKRAVQLMQKEKDSPPPTKDLEKRRPFGFDFYKRRNSTSSRDNLTNPSSEALQIGSDPLNAFSPLVSIYYLVKEKQERDRVDTAPKRHEPKNVADTPMPEIVPPPEAHTNTATYEMAGERVTGGRTRPRARTHGEDDAPEETKKGQQLSPKIPPPPPEAHADNPPKKESTAAGILRRFSTRRRRDPERLDKDRSHPPLVQVHSPSDTPVAPRKSFSIRRSRRDREDGQGGRIRSGSSQPQHRDLLSPPLSAGGTVSGSKKGLGRSTSVSSAEFRRRPFGSSNKVTKEPPPTSGSDQSAVEKSTGEPKSSLNTRGASMRAKSLGHARRESIQARRRRREGARAADVPEETDAEVGEGSGNSAERLDDSELAKPVFLKGLFSVSTTSTKSVPAIRADVKRVLKQLGVEYREIRGGFDCRHSPSIDLKNAAPGSPVLSPKDRQRFSFRRERDESRDLDRMPATPRTPGKGHADRNESTSDLSEGESIHRDPTVAARVTGDTTTQIQNDLGGNMVLAFEIFIVKVPLLSLHGLQFKRMEGNTWQFKNMADQILKELHL